MDAKRSSDESPAGIGRRCAACRASKPIKAFAFADLKTGRLQSYCRTCHAAYRRAHYERKRVQYHGQATAQRRRRGVANRRRVIAYLETHPCIDCGETDILVLEFDHRDPATKYRPVSALLFKPWASVAREIEKCDLRCGNCHRRRTSLQFGWRRSRVRRLAECEARNGLEGAA